MQKCREQKYSTPSQFFLLMADPYWRYGAAASAAPPSSSDRGLSVCLPSCVPEIYNISNCEFID